MLTGRTKKGLEELRPNWVPKLEQIYKIHNYFSVSHDCFIFLLKLDRIRLKGADRDQFLSRVSMRYYYGKSVRSSDCLSVRHTLAVYAHAHMHISSNCFHLLVGALTPVFWAHRPPLKIPRGTSSAEVLNTRGLNNLLFSVEIPVYIGNGRDRPTVLWITNRKSQVADRSVSVPMILKGVNFFSGGTPELRLHGLT